MRRNYLLVASMIAAVSACSTTNYKQGEGASPVTGSSNIAGGAEGANATLEKCQGPLGTAALVEPQHAMDYYASHGIQSPATLVRMLMQQSGCFVVVDRGAAMERVMMNERALEKSGELRSNSSFGGGQLVSADFSITPNITFIENNAGGASVGLAIGSMIPFAGPAIGAIGAAAQLKFKEAQTSLILVDNRSGIQVAMSEGSTSKGDAGGVLGFIGAYGNTNEGKIVASAYLDSFNKLVKSAKAAGYKYEPQDASALKPQKKKKSKKTN